MESMSLVEIQVTSRLTCRNGPRRAFEGIFKDATRTTTFEWLTLSPRAMTQAVYKRDAMGIATKTHMTCIIFLPQYSYIDAVEWRLVSTEHSHSHPHTTPSPYWSPNCIVREVNEVSH